MHQGSRNILIYCIFAMLTRIVMWTSLGDFSESSLTHSLFINAIFPSLIIYFKTVLKACVNPQCLVLFMSFQKSNKTLFSSRTCFYTSIFKLYLVLTCSRAANKYTAIKIGVKEVWPLFIKWIVYKKIRCPGITKRSRTWADLLFTPTIKKIKNSVKLFNYRIRFLFILI